MVLKILQHDKICGGGGNLPAPNSGGGACPPSSTPMLAIWFLYETDLLQQYKWVHEQDKSNLNWPQNNRHAKDTHLSTDQNLPATHHSNTHSNCHSSKLQYSSLQTQCVNICCIHRHLLKRIKLKEYVSTCNMNNVSTSQRYLSHSKQLCNYKCVNSKYVL